MGLSGLIAGGFNDALDDVTERRLQELARRIAEQQRQDQIGLQRQQLEMQRGDREADNARQQKVLDLANLKRIDEQNAAATERNARLDMANVLNMPGMSPEQINKEIAGSAMRTGVDVPKTVLDLIKAPEKKAPGTHVVDGNLVDDSGKVLFTAPKAPTKPEKLGVHVVGGTLVDDNGRVIFTDPNKAPKDGEQSPYSQERARRTIQSVDELMGKVNSHTAGYGSLLANLPATDARNFKAELDTLKANIAFNELTAMREASKTGGALGAVSDRESQLLQSALGALDAGQSPQNLKSQLQKVKESVERWQQATGQTGGGTDATAAALALIEKARAARKPQ